MSKQQDKAAAFLAGLTEPPPIAAKPTEENVKRRGGRDAKDEAAKLPPPGEASGLHMPDMTVRTWQKKRIVMNEPGIKAAMNQIGSLPETEWTIHGLMGGDFHGFDIIPMIHRLSGEPLEELHIATLGFNQKNNLQLCRMMDTGEIKGRVTIVASMYFAQSDPRVFTKAKEELEARGSRLANTRNHAKIISCLTRNHHIVVETSANLRSCNSLEHFSITNSEPLREFHNGWIESIAAQTLQNQQEPPP